MLYWREFLCKLAQLEVVSGAYKNVNFGVHLELRAVLPDIRCFLELCFGNCAAAIYGVLRCNRYGLAVYNKTRLAWGGYDCGCRLCD